jgi:hypothetical protein
VNYEILILLFLLFAVISSIINKLQARRRSQELEEEDLPGRPPVYRPEKDEVDLSEWEVFPQVEPPRAEPAEQEFQEVRGARRVEETDTGKEFQEVRGARPVTEPSPFAATSAPEPELTVADQRSISPVRKRRKKRLGFKRDTVRRAILYNEILGPPRADRMPW